MSSKETNYTDGCYSCGLEKKLTILQQENEILKAEIKDLQEKNQRTRFCCKIKLK